CELLDRDLVSGGNPVLLAARAHYCEHRVPTYSVFRHCRKPAPWRRTDAPRWTRVAGKRGAVNRSPDRCQPGYRAANAPREAPAPCYGGTHAPRFPTAALLRPGAAPRRLRLDPGRVPVAGAPTRRADRRRATGSPRTGRGADPAQRRTGG